MVDIGTVWEEGTASVSEVSGAKSVAYCSHSSTAAATSRSLRATSYRSEPCIEVEWRMAVAAACSTPGASVWPFRKVTKAARICLGETGTPVCRWKHALTSAHHWAGETAREGSVSGWKR